MVGDSIWKKSWSVVKMALQPSPEWQKVSQGNAKFFEHLRHIIKLGQIGQMRDNSAAILLIALPNIPCALFFPFLSSPWSFSFLFFSQSYHRYFCILMSVHHFGQAALKSLSPSDPSSPLLFSKDFCPSALAKVSHVSWTGFLGRWS